MLDYYGSIIIDQKYMSNSILETKKYKTYDKKYIYDIINLLCIEKLISDSYSISGWQIFHMKDVITKIDNYIIHDTIKCKKMLAFIKLKDCGDIEIYKKIYDNIKINII